MCKLTNEPETTTTRPLLKKRKFAMDSDENSPAISDFTNTNQIKKIPNELLYLNNNRLERKTPSKFTNEYVPRKTPKGNRLINWE